jgi:hypothetical protein
MSIDAEKVAKAVMTRREQFVSTEYDGNDEIAGESINEHALKTVIAQEIAAAVGWRPIEIAPKERGHKILLYSPTEGMAVSEWHPDWDCWAVIVDNLYVGDDDANPLYLKFPSYWMPLPNPPEAIIVSPPSRQ